MSNILMSNDLVAKTDPQEPDARRSKLSATQRRALDLQRAGAGTGFVQLDGKHRFDGDVAAVQARLSTLVSDVVVHRPDLSSSRPTLDAAATAVARERIAPDTCAAGGMPPRADIVVVAESEFRLILSASRWLADLASLRVIARAADTSQPLAREPAPDYADVVSLQTELLAEPESVAERAYWADAVGNAPSFAIDGDALLPAESLELPLAASLVSVDDATLLACWLQLLDTRFGDASSVACTLSPRDVDGLIDVIGPLAVVAPVTIGNADASLRRRQREVTEHLARADEHCLHYAGMEEAQDGVRAWRYGFASLELSDDEVSVHDDGEPHALCLAAIRRARQLALRICFDPGQYGRCDVEWLGRQYVALLTAAVRAPGDLLGEHCLAETTQRDFVAAAGRGPSLPVAEADFVARFASVVVRAPDALALHVDDLKLSYGEFDLWTNRIARLLLDEGMTPGQRVGICLPRSARQVASMIGVLKAGCTCVPIDPSHPAPRIARLVGQAGVALILTATGYLDRVSDSDSEVPLIDWERDDVHISALPCDAPDVRIHPEQIAYVIFTSGSTGEPKGVEVSHRALTNYVAAIEERLGLGRVGSIAALSTVAADLGYTALFGALGNGSCLRVLDESLNLDAAALADALDAAPVDCLKIVPSHLAALLALESPQRVLPRNCIVLGGEVLTWDLVQRLRALAPSLRVVNHYGPTETTIGITCNAHIGTRTQGFGVPLGTPLANDRTYVLDPQLHLCAVGIEGELCLAGAGVAAGYLGGPAETAARFLPDPHAATSGSRMYASGDRAVFDGSGALHFRGRADDQVKIRGHRVELGEIAAAARATEHVRECVVLLSEHAAGARLIAYAVGDAAAEAAVRDAIAGLMPEHMQPAVWVWLAQLPLNANGKLDRRALPEPEQAGRGATEPGTPVEAALLQLCRDLLANPGIGVDDNFFAIGADSIVAIQLVARARQLGLFFRPKQVFELQTIARLASVVELRATEGVSQEQTVGDAPLTAIQARYFAAVQVDRHHYNQACMYQLPATATYPALQRAAARLLQHHDGLRTAFLQDVEGRWRQHLVAWAPTMTADCCEQVTLPAGLARDAVLCREIERVQASFALDRAPLLRLLFVDDDTGAAPLLIAVAHHLVVDSYSWRIIEEDLHALLADAGALLPPKTCSAKAWAERASQALARHAWDGERGYWTDTELAIPTLPILPGDDRVGDAVSRRLVLPDELGNALAGPVHSAFNTNTQDFLLAALLSACAEWSGQDSLGVMLEGHGRDADDVDCGRTVGWFTSMYPVVLHASRGTDGGFDPVTLVTGVKERLRAVPGQGSGYAALRYLQEQGGGVRAAEPALCFNYLGRFGAATDAAQLRPASAMHLAQHATRSIAQPRLFAVEVLAMQQGDQLVVSFVYNPARIADAAVERLCQLLQSELTRLVAACSASAGGFTPSDVPDLHLQQDDLDALLAELSDVV